MHWAWKQQIDGKKKNLAPSHDHNSLYKFALKLQIIESLSSGLYLTIHGSRLTTDACLCFWGGGKCKKSHDSFKTTWGKPWKVLQWLTLQNWGVYIKQKSFLFWGRIFKTFAKNNSCWMACCLLESKFCIGIYKGFFKAQKRCLHPTSTNMDLWGFQLAIFLAGFLFLFMCMYLRK